MGTDELRAMIERASRYTEKCMEQTGRVEPMWHAVTEDGRDVIMPPPPTTKDLASILVRAMLRMCKAVRVIFIDETWMVETSPDKIDAVMEFLGEHGTLENHDGRKEVVSFNAEDDEGRTLTAMREIIRADGKVTLGPLKIDTPMWSEGRFVGMLAPKGTKQ